MANSKAQLFKSLTTVQQQTLHILTVHSGGFEYDEKPRYLCSAEYFNMPDWAPFMCVLIENSAFLGYFWQPESAIRSRNDFDERVTQYREEFNFR